MLEMNDKTRERVHAPYFTGLCVIAGSVIIAIAILVSSPLAKGLWGP